MEKQFKYKGYDVLQLENGNITIYNKGKFVAHANVTQPFKEDEIFAALDEMLDFAKLHNKAD